MSDQEVPLSGGTLTRGVVRIGQTVRRPRTEASDFVARLLRHLERVGYPGAPRFLGRDELDRDTLTFIAGETKRRPLGDHQVAAGARLLRAFHDATRGSELAGDRDLVCHGDPGPYNAIFHGELPVAFIDFDLAAPGAALQDLAFMAWFWCVSLKPERGPASKQARQVRLLLDAYGLESSARREIVDAMQERMDWNVEFQNDRRAAIDPAGTAIIVQATLDERAYLEAQRDVFLAALR